jgi:hypothetical protein
VSFDCHYFSQLDSILGPFFLEKMRKNVAFQHPLSELLVGASYIKTGTRTSDPIDTTTQNGAGFIFATVEKSLYSIWIFGYNVQVIS